MSSNGPQMRMVTHESGTVFAAVEDVVAWLIVSAQGADEAELHEAAEFARALATVLGDAALDHVVGAPAPDDKP